MSSIEGRDVILAHYSIKTPERYPVPEHDLSLHEGSTLGREVEFTTQDMAFVPATRQSLLDAVVVHPWNFSAMGGFYESIGFGIVHPDVLEKEDTIRPGETRVLIPEMSEDVGERIPVSVGVRVRIEEGQRSAVVEEYTGAPENTATDRLRRFELTPREEGTGHLSNMAAVLSRRNQFAPWYPTDLYIARWSTDAPEPPPRPARKEPAPRARRERPQRAKVPVLV